MIARHPSHPLSLFALLCAALVTACPLAGQAVYARLDRLPGPPGQPHMWTTSGLALMRPVDLDGDGFPDVVTARGYWLTDGRGRYLPYVSLPNVNLGGTVLFGDVDGDGDIDMYRPLATVLQKVPDE